jgi:hypothetical protein
MGTHGGRVAAGDGDVVFVGPAGREQRLFDYPHRSTCAGKRRGVPCCC